MLTTIIKCAAAQVDTRRRKLSELKAVILKDYEEAKKLAEKSFTRQEDILLEASQELVEELVKQGDVEKLGKLPIFLLNENFYSGLNSNHPSVRKIFYERLFNYRPQEHEYNVQMEISYNIIKKEALEIVLEMINKFPKMIEILETGRNDKFNLVHCYAATDVKVVKYLEERELISWEKCFIPELAQSISPQILAYLLGEKIIKEKIVGEKVNELFVELFNRRLDEAFFFAVFLHVGDFCGYSHINSPIHEFLQRVRTHYLDFLDFFHPRFPKVLIKIIVDYFTC